MFQPSAMGAVSRIALTLAIALALVCSAAALDDSTLMAQKKQELEQKEAELKAKEERLQEMEKTLDEKIKEYQDLKVKAEAYLKDIQVIQDGDMAHLIKTFENMPADAAAGRISSLDNALAVKLLRGMKTKSSGKVMAQIPPARAAVLSQLMVSR